MNLSYIEPPRNGKIQQLALHYDLAHEVLRDFISNRLAFRLEMGSMPMAFPNLRTFQIYADWIGPGLEPSDRPAKGRVDETTTATTTTTTRDLSSPTTEKYAHWIDLLERYADGYQMSGPGVLLLTGHQVWHHSSACWLLLRELQAAHRAHESCGVPGQIQLFGTPIFGVEWI
ncbi:hypothetical protein PG996_013998 [Apiospora saccharicola]|uniref:Uncharacterized protein n=1 Tax=Apiospora saccharicola TaxID=335842 RepID=A0ABR1TJN0_9PEZI